MACSLTWSRLLQQNTDCMYLTAADPFIRAGVCLRGALLKSSTARYKHPQYWTQTCTSQPIFHCTSGGSGGGCAPRR